MYHERQTSIGKIQSTREQLDAPRPVDRAPLADSPFHASELHESMQIALRAAVRSTRSALRHGEPDERCRKALDRMCEIARHDDLLAEQLLILVKDSWRRLPELQGVSRIDADFTLGCVITHCIKEFYRPSRRS